MNNKSLSRFSGVRAPLAKAKGLGSAHDGVHHWIQLRVTSIVTFILGCWFIYSLANLAGAGHDELMQFFASGLNAILMSLFIIATFVHTVLGLQEVIEDYVATKWKKLTMLLTIKIGFYGLAFACVLAIAKMHFAG